MIFVWTFDGVMQAIGFGLMAIALGLMAIGLIPWRQLFCRHAWVRYKFQAPNGGRSEKCIKCGKMRHG